MDRLVEEDSIAQRKIQYISVFLGNNDFLLGNKFSLLDIYTAYTFFFVQNCLKGAGVEDLVGKYPNLLGLTQRVFEQPGIKEYVQSDAWKNRPFCFPTDALFLN